MIRSIFLYLTIFTAAILVALAISNPEDNRVRRQAGRNNRVQKFQGVANRNNGRQRSFRQPGRMRAPGNGKRKQNRFQNQRNRQNRRNRQQNQFQLRPNLRRHVRVPTDGPNRDNQFVYRPNKNWNPGGSWDSSSVPGWLLDMLNSFLNNNNNNNNGNNNNNNNNNNNPLSNSPIIPLVSPGNTGTITTPAPISATKQELSSICGKSGNGKSAFIMSPNVRIVGGTGTEVSEMPWQVRVMSSTGRGTALCGGALINDKAVMTAAHCVIQRGTTVRVVLGDHSIRKHDTGEQTHSVSQILIHPQYSTILNNNDFAILLLHDPVKFSKYVRPACLPNSFESDYTGNNALISGWGRLSEMNPDLPDTLQKATTKIVTDSNCKQIYARGRITITDRMICARSRGVDTCQGDSGGPLTTVSNGRFTLIGITSFGIGCGQSFPGVYSRVSAILPWVQKTAGDYGTA